MGLTATTNPGGASKPGQAIKWKEEHTQALAGAEVILLPDVDATGLSDRQRVGLELIAAGCRVRFIDLRKAGTQLPPKGDITDLVDLVGADRAKVILSSLVASTPLATVEDLETEEVRRQRVLDEYSSRTPGYCIKDGCIARWDEGGGRALCTFVAYPAFAINTDNGVTRRGEYVIHAWDVQGNRLQPDAVVP